MKEQWKPVPEYEGSYEVSNLGRVRSVDRIVTYKRKYTDNAQRIWKGKVLAQRPHTGGYLYVHLSSNQNRKHHRVHRLVMMAFDPDVNHNQEVNHINNDRTDNALSNLEWVSRSENMKHAHENGDAVSPLNDPEIRARRWNNASP